VGKQSGEHRQTKVAWGVSHDGLRLVLGKHAAQAGDLANARIAKLKLSDGKAVGNERLSDSRRPGNDVDAVTAICQAVSDLREADA
jgi:hypothetical protein